MTLREERVQFTALLVDLLLYARESHPEAEIALDEGTVKSPRKTWLNGVKAELRDGVHRQGSRHHDGCAADLLVYVDGEYISDGEHQVYRDMGLQWESLHDLAVWGGRFASADANHFSLMSCGRSQVTHPPKSFGRINDRGIGQRELRNLVSEIEADIDEKCDGQKARAVQVTVEVWLMGEPE